ncbi:MAG: GIY-YIG nuclease family protein [Pseudomonadota bacterium]
MKTDTFSPKALTAPSRWESAPWIEKFGVVAEDPGYVYLIKNRSEFKIGRSVNPSNRLREAKTWIPDMEIVGVKPFWGHHFIERAMHLGFAHIWNQGEWFRPIDEGFRDTLVNGFSAFDDCDANRNSVDFIYWFNSEGMAEFLHEFADTELSVREFQEVETALGAETQEN